jgi:hypothetical protein
MANKKQKMTPRKYNKLMDIPITMPKMSWNGRIWVVNKDMEEFQRVTFIGKHLNNLIEVAVSFRSEMGQKMLSKFNRNNNYGK